LNSFIIVRMLECNGVLNQGAQLMATRRRAFDPENFLSTVGAGRQMKSFRKGQTIFAQGDAADSVFVIQKGTVKLSARSSPRGKEATLDILNDKHFVGKDCVADQPIRIASAIALTDCTLLRIEKETMMLALAREVTLSNRFCSYVLARNIRYQQDLIDQRCSPSEKRLARILLLLSHFGEQSSPEAVVPYITHETLAEMVGTTRSRICFFMRKFRASGFIEYKLSRPMRVRQSLLTFCAR
jgi:CRP/FNR family cyclic AMP-dependent transcriptional regulator